MSPAPIRITGVGVGVGSGVSVGVGTGVGVSVGVGLGTVVSVGSEMVGYKVGVGGMEETKEQPVPENAMARVIKRKKAGFFI